MITLKPVLLHRGSTVGLVALSAPDAAACPRRLQRSIANLKAAGLEVDQGNSTATGIDYLAGTARERAAAFNGLVANPRIGCIMSCVGGENTNAILDLIDYGLFSRSPKAVVGYSDFTALLLALYAHTGCVVFHGPAALPQFGEPCGVDTFTWRQFQKVLFSPYPAGELPFAALTTDEFLEWDVSDVRARVYVKHAGPRTFRGGIAEGVLMCANLDVWLSLHGTHHLPSMEGAIVGIEESDGSTPAAFERKLFAMYAKGMFDGVAGIVFGQLPSACTGGKRRLSDILMDVFEGIRCPIGQGFNFGHTDPQLTLPLGVHARLDCTEPQARLSLLEGAVERRACD